MAIRITSIPRPSSPNSGYHPIKVAEILKDEVWAIPAIGNYIGSYSKIKFFMFDKDLFYKFTPSLLIRFFTLASIFFRSLNKSNEIFFVHSYMYALPLFILRKKYVIIIHGTDSKHLNSYLGKMLARKSIAVFGVGFSFSSHGFSVKEIPNIFNLSSIEIKNTDEKSYDAIFVLRNAPIKNPKYPFNLYRNLEPTSNIKISVVGLEKDFLSIDEINFLQNNKNSNSIKYFGRCSFAKVVSLMNASSSIIIPSHSEGVAKAMLEAMACGLHVIVSKKLKVPDDFKKNIIQIDIDNWVEVSNTLESCKIKGDNFENINFANRYHKNSTKNLIELYNSVLE